MFKHLLTLAAAAYITMSASADILWQSYDENGVLVDWGKPCIALSAEKAAEVIAPGDYINVSTVAVDPENQWPQVAIFGEKGGWPPLANEGVGNRTYPCVSSFPVTNEIYDAISADGLSVSGNGAYVDKVEVVSSGVEVGPYTVWFGNKECNWGNGVSLPAALFADVKVHDKLVFYTSDMSFQVLLGGWSGLNLPAYDGSIANKTYVDGVTTITFIPEYAEDTVYEEGKDAINVFALLKQNGVVMHGTTTITRIDYIPTDILAEDVGHATTIEGWEDTPNIAPAEDLQVQVLKGDKVRVNAWAGVEGYDLIISYDEDFDITEITTVVKGVESKTYKSGGYAYLYTGNDDEYFAAYLSAGYDMAGADLEEEYGLVFLQGYHSNGEFMYYYMEWPLTAEELSEAILAAYEEDVAQVQQWSEYLTELQSTNAGFAATEAGAEALAAIAKAIQENYNAVADAIETAAESWGYTSPLTSAVITEVNELILNAVAAKTEFEAAIDEAAQADMDFLMLYVEEIEEFMVGEDVTEDAPEIAEILIGEILDLQKAIEAAGNEALEVTGVYVSPLTEEVVAGLDELLSQLKTCAISGMSVEADSANYFDLNGMPTINPAAGQVVIKVQNGKAAKVYVK